MFCCYSVPVATVRLTPCHTTRSRPIPTTANRPKADLVAQGWIVRYTLIHAIPLAEDFPAMPNRLPSILTAAVLIIVILLPLQHARAQSVNQQLAAGSVLEIIKKRGSIKVGMSTFVPWAQG